MGKKLEFILVIVLLSLAAAFRFIGLDWDAGHQLHPDERFLFMVEGAISWVRSLGEYFDTAQSPLNPHNRGYSFFVYGTLPIFIVKALAITWERSLDIPLHIIGRGFSAVCDMGTVLLVYLIARALRDAKTGLFAMFLSACSVLQIQHAHFGVVDGPLTFFITATVGFAVWISKIPSTHFWRALLLSVAFGFFCRVLGRQQD